MRKNMPRSQEETMKKLIVDLLTEKGLLSARVCEKDDSVVKFGDRFKFRAVGYKMNYLLSERKIVIEIGNRYLSNPIFLGLLQDKVIKTLEESGAKYEKDFEVKLKNV